jgi:hypothetical protein
MTTTLVSGEQITVLCELGFPANPFTLDDAVLGVLDEDYLDGTLLGDDISEYISDLSITRGRSDEFESFRAGIMTMTLVDNARRFDPLNQSSPYWDTTTGKSGVQPRRKVTVLSGGVPIFTGRITEIDVNYDYQLSTVTITAADDFVLLANTATEILLTPTEQLSGARVSYLLDLPEISYPATRSIATGTTTLGAYDIAANTNALAYLQRIAQAEQGLCFIAADGTLTFTDRVTAAFATIEAVFSDAVGHTDIGYEGLAVAYGQQFLYNRVQAYVEGGTVQTSEDLTSQADYGVSTLTFDDLLLSSDAQALALTADLLDTYSVPEFRFDDLQVKVSAMSSIDRATVIGLEIGDVVQITRSFSTGSPASVTELYGVDRVVHRISANAHTVTLGLYNTAILYPFTLDDATYGVLDSSNALT